MERSAQLPLLLNPTNGIESYMDTRGNVAPQFFLNPTNGIERLKQATLRVFEVVRNPTNGIESAVSYISGVTLVTIGIQQMELKVAMLSCAASNHLAYQPESNKWN